MVVYVTEEEIRQADHRTKYGWGRRKKEFVGIDPELLDLLAGGLAIKVKTGVVLQLSPEEESFSLPLRRCPVHTPNLEECEHWCYDPREYLASAKAGFVREVVF